MTRQAAFELTVLGSAGSHTGPGRLCSSYLVRAGETTVLLDAGNGSTANLQRIARYHDLDAVFVSHRHVDHCVDLVGVFYALRFDPTFERRLDLYAPDGVVETLTGLLSADSAMAFGDVFAAHRITGGDVVELPGLRVELFDARHPPPAVSMRLSAHGRVLAYSGDTAGDDALVACARDADLLLCEATWQGDDEIYPPGIHLTARGAGRIAQRAGASHLLLTHVEGGLDPAISVAEAAETFDGLVEAAEDLRSWMLA